MGRPINARAVTFCHWCGKCSYRGHGQGRCAYCKCKSPHAFSMFNQAEEKTCNDPDKRWAPAQLDEMENGLRGEGFWGY